MIRNTKLIVAAAAFCLVTATRAWAQEPSDALACWWDYAGCASESHTDENWRSICYADFSSCLGKQPLPDCSSTAPLPDCEDYRSQCEALASGDPTRLLQCDADADACALAHGC